MKKQKRYSAELRERAVRLVFENQGDHESQWAAVCSIAGKIGCTSETLRKWVRQAERDVGRRAGLTTSERERLKQLERENDRGMACVELITQRSGARCARASAARQATRKAA